MRTKLTAQTNRLSSVIVINETAYKIQSYPSTLSDFRAILCKNDIYIPLAPEHGVQEFNKIIDNLHMRNQDKTYFDGPETVTHYIEHQLFRIRINQIEKNLNKYLKTAITKLEKNIARAIPITTHRRNGRLTKVHLKFKIFIPNKFYSDGAENNKYDITVDPSDKEKQSTKKLLLIIHGIPNSFDDISKGFQTHNFNVRILTSNNLDKYIKYHLQILINTLVWDFANLTLGLTGNTESYTDFIVETLDDIISNKKPK